MKEVSVQSLHCLQFMRAKLLWLTLATFENSAHICSCWEYHENLCRGRENRKFRQLSSALVKQISFRPLPANFETLSVNNDHILNFLNYVWYMFLNLPYTYLYKFVVVLSTLSILDFY